MSLGLLEEHGAGAFICGRDRFAREILPREDAAGVFATVDCADLFADVALPCLITFYIHPENGAEGSEDLLVTARSSREGLTDPALAREVADAMRVASAYVNTIGALSVGPLRVEAGSPRTRPASP
jgi:hypothetical protein